MTGRALAELPKAHLHLHLEAAMRPSTLHELADEHGITVPELTGFSTFADFIAVYQAATESLRRPDDLRRLLREVAEDGAADGAAWVELHVYPPLWFGRFGSDEDALDLTLEAAGEATAATGVGLGLVLAADRTHDAGEAVRMARMGVARRDAGVTTFGLANDETGNPPEPFAEAFRVARDGGLLSAPHAGELGGPESVRAAIDVLGADRLGHGVRAVEDRDLVARLADEGIVCDVCPTSNVVLGLYPSIKEHPVGQLLEAGVPVTLNTDDPLLFGAGLLDEYEAVRRAFALDDQAVAAIARTSIEASGAPEGTKRDALAGIDSWLGD
ncbi:MAG: adenosine deaminase [Acidimicrobiales bacterium]|nr:adenosine deaminase [Acidimicrobiales bacterium]